MSLKNTTTPEKNVVELEISIDRETFKAAVDDAFKKRASSIVVPGFRRGKAPRGIIEKMYGKGVFYEDALEVVVPAAFREALEESGEKPVSRPEYNVTEVGDDGVVFTARFYVKPEVTISQYKGLEVERLIVPVTDEMVDGEIERVRNRNGREIEVTDRPAAEGDTVDINYTGKIKGEDEPFEGGTAEHYRLKLGSGAFIPGFESQIVGHNTGDEFEVEVTFPEDYHAEELAGKPAVFSVKLNSINYVELPELDDEFAKDVSEFDTFDEYKADVRAKIEKAHDNAAEMGVSERLADMLVANMEADIPVCMIDDEVEEGLRQYENRMRAQGISLDMYLKYTGTTLEQLREELRPRSERQVKVRLALEKIAELENIVVSEEELEAEFNDIATTYGVDVEEVKKSIDRDIIESDLKLRAAMKLVRDNAVVTDKIDDPSTHKHDHDHEHGEDCDCEDSSDEASPEDTEN
ncbi:MAG: trigger factor [Eubacteriales bacterium]|jgi:trigger factor|nr:trigger factor [Clostridiales bacterium]